MKKIGYKFIYLLVITIVLWHLVSALIHSKIVPAPFAVIYHTYDIFTAKIFIHCLYSLKRIISGILLSILIGWPLGILIGYYRCFDRFISPLVYFFYPIPKVAFLPIIMLLFGLGERSKILMIFLITIFQVLISIRDLIKTLDERYFYPLLAIDAKNYSILRHILIPASLPRLLSSIRIALATSISVLFFAETFGTTYGLGYFIMDAMLRINYIDMYSGILVLSLLGFSLFALIDIIEKKIIKW